MHGGVLAYDYQTTMAHVMLYVVQRYQYSRFTSSIMQNSGSYYFSQSRALDTAVNRGNILCLYFITPKPTAHIRICI